MIDNAKTIRSTSELHQRDHAERVNAMLRGEIGKDAHDYERLYQDKPETFFQGCMIVLIAAGIIGCLFYLIAALGG